MMPLRLTGEQLFSNTRYDRLTIGIRRKSLQFLEEFDKDVFNRSGKLVTDLDWLIYAKELIENEIKNNQKAK